MRRESVLPPSVLLLTCLLACLLTCLLAGCISSSVINLGEDRFPPADAEAPVLLFDRAEDLDRPYVKLARLHADGSSSVSFAELVERMRADARRIGAEALILGQPGRALENGGEEGVSWRRTYTAIAIRFTGKS